MIQDVAQSVLAARRKFRQDGAVPDDLVPSPIVRSWRRCAGLGFDMAARPRVEPLAARELRELIERHERLRRLCRPELEALLADANATDSIVILTDATGMVLDTIGSAGFADCAARVALRPGVIWSETATGTNAIGTALIERRPIDVRGAEHYFEPHRVLSCSAAPILDPRGELAGVLDLSGHASVHHLHALGLVRLAVDQIEHRLFDQDFERCDVLRLHCDPALIGTPREGILVFDDHRLVAANRYGLALLDLTPEALGARRFSDLFGNGFARLEPQCRLRSHRGHELFARLRRASERAAPSRRPRAAGMAAVGPEPWFDAAACTARATAVRLVNAEIPVLIHGETGVGKEVFARQIHAHSARATRPFVAVNCAALPESLIESELFGYEEGAFTGARRQGSIGLLRQADGGILFLDEIGDMPLALQARLLRVLQERQVTPLGGGAPVAVDFTVVCATHRNLRELIDSGAFRADLYFRIAQYTVALPPLRSFPDRAAIITALWGQLDAAGVTLTPEAVELLAAYEWPGNFRQLAGTLRALSVLAEPGQPLTPAELPAEIRQWRAPGVAGAAPPATAGRPAATPATPTVAAPGPLPGLLEDVEVETMRQALAVSGGNVSEAARRLGINRSTLYRRLLSEGAGR